MVVLDRNRKNSKSNHQIDLKFGRDIGLDLFNNPMMAFLICSPEPKKWKKLWFYLKFRPNNILTDFQCEICDL